jgi:protocatechuate 3,4-dioxygenase beta subunit
VLSGLAVGAEWDEKWAGHVAKEDFVPALRLCLGRLDEDPGDRSAWEGMLETASLARERKAGGLLVPVLDEFARGRSDGVLGQLVAALAAVCAEREIQAHALLAQLERTAPDEVRLYGLLARIHLEQGEVRAADRAVRLALEIDPFCVDARLTRVRLLIAQKQFNSAQDVLENIATRSAVYVPAKARLARFIEGGLLETGQGVVRGRCVGDADGRPLVGAFIQVSAVVPSGARGRKYRGHEKFFAVFSDTEGRFVLRDVPVGLYNVTGHLRTLIAEAPKPVRVIKDRASDPVELRFAEGLRFEVTVLDAVSGRPVVAAAVEAEGKGREPVRGTTDASGTAQFAGLFTGAYQLHASAPGYLTGVRTVILSGRGLDRPYVLKLRKGVRLDGLVLDAEGHRVGGVRVFVVARRKVVAGEQAEAEVARNGRFTFESINPGISFRVVAFKPELGFASSDTVTGEGGQSLDLTVRFAPPIRIAGEVRDQDGRAVPDADVYVRLDADLELDDDLLRFKLRSDELGLFRTRPLSPGRYRLIAKKDGYVADEFTSFELAPETGQCVLRVVRAAEIRGLVRDGEGHPISGALVYALRSHGVKDYTGKDGRFTLTPLKPGTYDLLVIAKPLPSQRRRGIEADGPPVEITLAKPAPKTE